MLYIRMLLMMVVSLYTSRVVLATLGVTDFGIYGVVGGIVSMFSFINGAMATGTQRYLSYELGRGDKEQLRKVFSMSINIHLLLALIILLLSETIGLWFLYEKMVIPAERLTAAFWVYQFSILTTLVMVLSVPYNAVIIAHERMSAFAYISIFEAVAKLLIVYLLLLCKWDRLILFSVLMLVVQLSIRFIYGFYCKRHFPESCYYFVKDKALFKEMLGFSGWNFWGSCAVMGYTQGLNILLNMFFGPTVNAARNIAVQVQAAASLLSSNFQMALNPQIIKTYASNEINQMHLLIFRSAKITYLFLFILSVPILLKTNYILILWLKDFPNYSIVFIRLMLCITIVDAVSNPFMVASAATGEVKRYQTILGAILLLIVPISYLVLMLGFPPYSVFIVHLSISILAFGVRLLLISSMIKMSLKVYTKQVIMPLLLFTIFALFIPGCSMCIFYKDNFANLIFIIFLNLLSAILLGYVILLNTSERKYISTKIASLLKK